MKDEHIIVSDKVAKILRESNLNNAMLISILEMLKIDIILNTGMVEIGGKPLENVNKEWYTHTCRRSNWRRRNKYLDL